MIILTKAAAKQVKVAMTETDAEGMSLRIAARRLEDGSFDYAMGFDDTDHNDTQARSHGVDVVVAPTSAELLQGATLDFVEIDGEPRFIFINPNDPSHSPLQDNAEPGEAPERETGGGDDPGIDVTQHGKT